MEDIEIYAISKFWRMFIKIPLLKKYWQVLNGPRFREREGGGIKFNSLPCGKVC